MTPQQALSNLATAARAARLTAEEHEAVQESIKVLLNFVQNATLNGNLKGNLEDKKSNSK